MLPTGQPQPAAREQMSSTSHPRPRARPDGGPNSEHVAGYPGLPAPVVLLLLHNFPNRGDRTGFMGIQLGGKVIWAGFTGLWLRCGDWRAAAGGCPCASLMMKLDHAQLAYLSAC